MKGTLTEIKNNLQGIQSRVDKAENQINILDHIDLVQINETNSNQ